MFCWYQASAACYALLSDVKVDPNKDIFDSSMAASAGNSLPLDDTVIQELRSSRWFTRGWTLQELVAPSNVHFYSQEWTYLGSKKDKNGFQDLISGITGITAVILDGLISVEELSVAQRMQWASGRHTTRSEDLAYCLMGIFGVNMPLLYGKGMKSFALLQEEILKGSNDQSLFAWVSTAEYPGPVSGLSGLLPQVRHVSKTPVTLFLCLLIHPPWVHCRGSRMLNCRFASTSGQLAQLRPIPSPS
ncbi:hypothetical protein BKA65DRAFT_225114 [Rhexocercosporidium sp. MPI-PUGE-AT-0058]|nr:hypothetical protein BKA65DRAFT_225114 [Rhexocercosporidium sp. MPI-PUGE-AT-0058]